MKNNNRKNLKFDFSFTNVNLTNLKKNLFDIDECIQNTEETIAKYAVEANLF